MENDAGLHDACVQGKRSRAIGVLSRASLRDVGIRGVLLAGRWLDSTGSLKHMALLVNPSVSDVLDEESQEQASHQYGTGGSLIFDAGQAVIVEENLSVREQLHFNQ